jgi:hypothetical protein
VLQHEVVEQSHDLLRQLHEALFAVNHAFGQCPVRQASTPADDDAVAVKFQVLDVQAQDFADAQAAITHEQQDALELQIARRVLEVRKRFIANGSDAALWLLQLQATPGHLSSAGMHQERLEAAEAVGNLLVQDGVGQHLPALHVVAVETGDSGQDGVDAALREAARQVKRMHLQLAVGVAQPLDEAQEVVGGDGTPVQVRLF